jgi:hypothetical protein
MRTEREILQDIKRYQEALKTETNDWSRQAFAARICAFQWVLFEPKPVVAETCREASRLKRPSEMTCSELDAHIGYRPFTVLTPEQYAARCWGASGVC